MPLKLTTRPDGVLLTLKVVPNSSCDRIAGEYAGGLKINITKFPKAGAANKAVIALLAKTLGIPATNIEILRGHTRPWKEVVIRQLTAETIRTKLSNYF